MIQTIAGLTALLAILVGVVSLALYFSWSRLPWRVRDIPGLQYSVWLIPITPIVFVIAAVVFVIAMRAGA